MRLEKQERGDLMSEVKTILKRMAFYYLLLALNIIPCASVIPDTFPTRNLSTIYLLFLCVCLVLYYAHRVSPTGGLSVMMKSLSWMGLLLILLRGIKYSAFSQVGILARHTWYLYYVPLLLIPLFFFYISLLVSPKEDWRIPKGWYWTLALTVLMIVLVLSNDLHQLVFRFAPNFENWDNAYTHGWLFYVITGWQYALYIAAGSILVMKCRISSAKKHAWLMLIPFLLGILMNSLLITGKMPKLNGTYLLEFPEVLIFTAAIILECCMQLGLIPTNKDYAKLFEKFSIRAQITDRQGTPVYASSAAIPITREQFALPDGARIGAHTLMHKMEIPGGFGFWQDDMTEIDRLNEELSQAKEDLAQESELIRLRNELKEQQTQIQQRTLVYDTIAGRTQKQSQAISHFANMARTCDDAALKDQYRKRITLLGAYIKRYANLMLLSQERGIIEAEELGLSVSEVLRYLNFCSIPGEYCGDAHGTVSAPAALAVFEAFATLLESNYDCLRGAFVNLSSTDTTVVFKLTLEYICTLLSPSLEEELSLAAVSYATEQEDEVTYICFILPKGGETI